MNKILYVHNADFSKTCANRIQVLNMCKAFEKIGVSITLISFNCDKNIIKKIYNEDIDYNTIFLKPFVNYYFRSLLLFLRFLTIKNDYKYIYTRDLIFAFLVSRFFKDKKVIYELHDLSNGKMWHFLFKRTFKNLQGCVVISKGLKEELIKNDFNGNNIYVLHDGVDLEKFDINISKEDARTKLNLPKNKIIISYVGNTSENRDLKTFINVAKKLNNIVFVVYGKKQDYLVDASSKLDNFIFGGYIDETEIVYKASDVVFAGYTEKVPTINYMSPLKLFEYMASKRPIIISDFPRIREVVSENEVLFYKAEDEEDLALKVEKLISDINLQNKLVNNAFEKVKEYTWEKRAKEIISKCLEGNYEINFN